MIHLNQSLHSNFEPQKFALTSNYSKPVNRSSIESCPLADFTDQRLYSY